MAWDYRVDAGRRACAELLAGSAMAGSAMAAREHIKETWGGLFRRQRGSGPATGLGLDGGSRSGDQEADDAGVRVGVGAILVVVGRLTSS